MIHSPGTIPLIDSNGIDLPPNRLTSVGLRATNMTRQPAPYPSKCIDDWPTKLYHPEMVELIKNNKSMSYSYVSRRYMVLKFSSESLQIFGTDRLQPPLRATVLHREMQVHRV